MKKWLAVLLMIALLAANTAFATEWEWVEMPTSVDTLLLSGVVIGLDPGHQEHWNRDQETIAPDSTQTKAKVSSGTEGVKTHVPEYVVVLDIGLQLRDALEELGATVYMTRVTHDVDLSNQDRAKMLNEKNCDLVLRLHCDGAEGSGPHGLGMFVSQSNSIAEESYRAAEYLLSAMGAATGARENGVYQNDSYTGLNWSTVPCILVEMGFMSNPEEDEKLNTPEYQQLLVKGMVDGICDYIAAKRGE